MDDIIAGVRTYQRDVFPQQSKLIERLAEGQSPEALIITCSDSRVDPRMFTQSEPGKLFELRNAGNFVPRFGGPVGGVTATIEFAVVALQVPNIIVCGHFGCGAIAGLLNPDLVRRMPRVEQWLEQAAVIRESMTAARQLDAPDAMERAVEANVIVQLENLRTHPSVAVAMEHGKLSIYGWVYDFVTGSVLEYKDRDASFAPLGE